MKKWFIDFEDIWSDAKRETFFWGNCGAPDRIHSYEDFTKIPELKKRDIHSSLDDYICRNAKIRSYVTTGGSTGDPLKIPVNDSHAKRCRLQQKLGRSMYDIHYGDRCFLIWGHSAGIGPGFSSYIERVKRKIKDQIMGYYRLSAYELGYDTLCRSFDSFLRFKPRWVCGYSSALVAFARANWQQRSYLKGLNLKAVLCSAEMIRQSEIHELEAFFSAPVISEYGAMEFGPIAYTRPNEDGYYGMDDLILEALPTDREFVYRLLVTSLYRRPLPMIRYDVGDEVKINDPEFSGGIITRFDEVFGRENDIIRFHDGSAVHSETITHAIKTLDHVISFQFHKWEDVSELWLVTCKDADRAGIEDNIRSKLTFINAGFRGLKIVYVEDVDVTVAGKRRWIVEHHCSKGL